MILFRHGNALMQMELNVDGELNEAELSVLGDAFRRSFETVVDMQMKRDPDVLARRKVRRAELEACFEQPIYVEEVANEYNARNHAGPWLRVTTKRGRIIIGWRKRVIEITWETGPNASLLFGHEDVTMFDQTIHAWSYADAKRYISKLMEVYDGAIK